MDVPDSSDLINLDAVASVWRSSCVSFVLQPGCGNIGSDGNRVGKDHESSAQVLCISCEKIVVSPVSLRTCHCLSLRIRSAGLSGDR